MAPAALAGPRSPTTAAVSMGDSYISGEAGRWNGNSITPFGDKSGTDRACLPAGDPCQVDKSRVGARPGRTADRRGGQGRGGRARSRARLRSSPRLAHLRPTSRSRRRFRYCVKGSSARVVAVFGRRARVELARRPRATGGAGPGRACARSGPGERSRPCAASAPGGASTAPARAAACWWACGGGGSATSPWPVAASLRHRRVLRTHLRRAGL